MATVEKLVVQIFERKNWIIEQVKQQTELYNQHLAAKLLIDGITPPSWLLSPNNSDSKELNKEEMIFKLLRPCPQPSVSCSIAPYPLYNNEELSNGFFMENLASHRGVNTQEDPKVSVMSMEDHVGCVPSSVPEGDVGVTSPENQADQSILNIYHAPEQSLARIQRSKSRQKALELRNSASAQAKGGSGHESISDFFPSRIRLSMSASEQGGQKDEVPKSAEHCVSGSQICNGSDIDEACRPSKEKVDVYTGRVTRSRSATVPVVLEGSSKFGQSSQNCREDIPSHVSKLRERGTVLSFDSELVDADKLLRSTPAVCSRSCEGRKVDGVDCLNKPNKSDAYAGKVTRTNCACASLNVDSNNQRMHISTMDTSIDLPHDCDDGSLLSIGPNFSNEGCRSHGENDDILSRSHSPQNDCVNETSDPVVPSSSPKADGSILAQSGGRSTLQVNDSSERMGSFIPSVAVVHRATTSPFQCNDQETSNAVNISKNHSIGDTMPISSCKQKSAANDELQNASRGQTIPSFDDAHDVLQEQGDSDFVIDNELSLHDLVDQSAIASSKDAGTTRNLESLVAHTSSDCIALVEPMQIDFSEIEDCNLRTFALNSGKRRLDNLPGKTNCSSLGPAISLDEETSGCVDQLYLDKQSAKKSEVSSKGEESQRDSFVSDTQEDPGSSDEEYGPIMSKSSGDNTFSGKICENSEVQHDAATLQRKTVELPDLQSHPMKRHEEQMDGSLRTLPETQIDEEGWIRESKHMNPLVSNAPESVKISPPYSLNSVTEPTTESNYCLIEKVDMENPTPLGLHKVNQFPAKEVQILSCLDSEISRKDARSPTPHGEDLPRERRFRSATLESWPQLKRRKIEHEQTNTPTTFPSFRLRKPHGIQGGPIGTNLKNKEVGDNVLMAAFDVRMSNGLETLQDMDYNLTEGIESTSGAQNEEVEMCYKQQSECNESPSLISVEQLGASLGSSLTKKKPRSSQGCSEDMITPYPQSNNFVAESAEHFLNLEADTDNSNSEDLTFSNRMLQGVKSSPRWEDGLQSQHHVLSLSNKDLEHIDFDQSMPVLEGFSIDTQGDAGEPEFAADGIDFDKLTLPRSALERASILAEICRSASMDTPLSNISSAYEFQGTKNSFQSESGGLLEHLDLRSTFPLHCNIDKQVRYANGLADGEKGIFERMPYTDCGPYPGSRYGWNSRNHHASPVGKLWERRPSHTGSSEKSVSSNPELTCFRIEEDPSTSEENKHENDLEEIDSSLANNSDKRQPLKDLSNLGLNSSLSVSAQKETMGADNFVCLKLSDTGTQDKVQQSPKYQYRNNNERRETKKTSCVGATEGRKKQNLSVGLNGFKNGKESISNSMYKKILSGKTLKRQDTELSFKESKRNNIVSNVSSFIPLVQQKQAAAACAGKRDVKVKALEVAEAAKRLEVKKENERKLRKEALKLERAKLEEKNLRHLELEKKKKEEERKKKEADIVARKRLREEEERKEKEKKRMRVEAKQRQREQEEKTRAEKAEKEKQRFKDEQMNNKKELYKESKMLNHEETVRGDKITLKEAETRSSPMQFAVNIEECSTSLKFSETGKKMEMVDRSPPREDLIVQKEKSYEISPYQSDDEDEESDDLHANKYIPPWVSKMSVAQHLASQKEIDPEGIFLPKSFCTIDEVVLPRKL